MNKIIDKFNTESTCLVISDYPEKTVKGEKNHGIAWYTKELTKELSKRYKLNFVILAERHGTEDVSIHDRGHTAVFRVFDEKHPVLFPRIVRWLYRFNKIKNVHVHSEFCANGGTVNMILLLPFLILIKLSRRRITYFAHNVAADLTPIATHLNLKTDSLLFFLLSRLLPTYYRLLSHIVDEVIVLDDTVEKRLKKYCDPKKITLLPIWTTKHHFKLSKTAARQKLGLKHNELVLLYFGFITYYKGADWLIDTVLTLRKKKAYKNVKLIMAGGPAHSLQKKSHYKRYYKSVLELAQKDPTITMTGFVNEDDIGLYFTACDLFVLPYRDLMGASGSLIHALSYGVPFAMSDKTQNVMTSNPHFEALLKAKKLRAQDMTFTHSRESFITLLQKMKIKQFRDRYIAVSKKMAKQRSVDTVMEIVHNKLFNKNESLYKEKRAYDFATN